MAFSLRHFSKAAPRRSPSGFHRFRFSQCGVRFFATLRSLASGKLLATLSWYRWAGKKMEKGEAGMSQLIGLCGQRYCPRVCERVCHCPAGKAREIYLLQLQALCRITKSLERKVHHELTG